jgi:hypothetical protein
MSGALMHTHNQEIRFSVGREIRMTFIQSVDDFERQSISQPIRSATMAQSGLRFWDVSIYSVEGRIALPVFAEAQQWNQD